MVKSADPEYLCDPIPPEWSPPVGQSALRHLIEHPECLVDGQDWILKQFPKRRKGELVAQRAGPTLGWGIYLNEGWDWNKLRYILLACVLGDLLFALLWTTCKEDIQGAFTVAAYISAAATVVLGWIGIRPV